MLVAACLLLLLSSPASPHWHAGRMLRSSTEDGTHRRGHGEGEHRHLAKVFHSNGRLGNHMREWASGIGLAHRNGLEMCAVVVDFPELPTVFKGPFPDCEDREKTGIVLNEDQGDRVRTFRFRDGEEVSDISLTGYQLNCKNFFDARRQVAETFTLLDGPREAALKFLEPYQNKIKIGIHVRRGDKTGPNWVGRLPTMHYFADAIARARQDFPDAELAFFISSDSIDWCKEQEAFQSEDIYFIENKDFLQNSVIFDFAVLMQMDHFILSEGTFGWWAAWLGAWQRDGTVYHSGKNDWENWVDNNGIPGYKAVAGDSHALYFPVRGGATE